jgi:hypothetical protein
MTSTDHIRAKRRRSPKPGDLLDEYVPLSEAAQQPNMPCLRTLQRMRADGRLRVIYFGSKPFLHGPTFREDLQASGRPVVSGRTKRR